MSSTFPLLIGVDYELFFGSRTGAAQDCLLAPTDALATVLERHGCKLVLFVDVCYLLALRNNAARWPTLARDQGAITAQLSRLCRRGHELQLHVHPHWLDCMFDGNAWQMNLARYRLHDFSSEQCHRLIADGKAVLEEIGQQAVFAYRAGGWCLQPFAAIRNALRDNGIWIDSTVYPGGLSEDPLRWFDFRDAPQQSHWRFSTDPNRIDSAGEFVEVPISSQTLGPEFYWRMALLRRFGGEQHRSFGKGAAMQAHSAHYLERLTRRVCGPVSVDGTRAGALNAAWKAHRQRAAGAIFNVMGHPKALTPYSLVKLGEFLAEHAVHLEPIRFADLQSLKP
jgi:hypothetical protein